MGTRSFWSLERLLMPNEVIEFHLAWPDPYKGYLNQIIHADLIISQGVWTPRAVGLVTAHDQGRHSRNYAIAASFAMRVSGVDAVSTADGLHWCNNVGHKCRTTFGWDELPFTLNPVHWMVPGHSFVLNVWDQPRLLANDPTEDTTGLSAPVQNHCAYRLEVEPDDVHSVDLEPGTPVLDDAPNHDSLEEPDDPPQDSPASIHSGDMSVMVYRLNAPDDHCFVTWTMYMTTLAGILHELRLPRRLFRCFMSLLFIQLA